MNERTAMHEISHTLGIGQTTAFNTRCAANNWPRATPLLQSWDGAGVRINCGGGHICKSDMFESRISYREHLESRQVSENAIMKISR